MEINGIDCCFCNNLDVENSCCKKYLIALDWYDGYIPCDECIEDNDKRRIIMQNLLTMSILEEVVGNKPMTFEVIEGERQIKVVE